MEQKSLVLLEDKVVIYQRERSNVWQARVELADGKWHRQNTREHNEADAKLTDYATHNFLSKLIKIFYLYKVSTVFQASHS